MNKLLTPKRCLIDGPFINISNIDDLLYYDSIICADQQMTIINHFDSKIVDKLIDGGLLVNRKDIFDEYDLNAFESQYPSFKNMKGAMRSFPEQGNINRALAEVAKKYRIRATPKYSLQEFTSEHKNDKSEVLSLLIHQIPRIKPTTNNISYLVDFLCSEETIEKKDNMFNWQSKIERELKNGQLEIEDVYDILEKEINDYMSWLKIHINDERFKIYSCVCEIIFGLAMICFKEPLLGTYAVAKGTISLNSRRADLEKQELSAPGYELAYIPYVDRKIRNI